MIRDNRGYFEMSSQRNNKILLEGVWRECNFGLFDVGAKQTEYRENIASLVTEPPAMQPALTELLTF